MTINRKVVAALVALLAAIGVTIAVIPGDDGAPATITVKVDGPDKDRARDDELVLNAPAVAELRQAQTATEQPGDTHRELADPLREPDDGPVVLNEGPLAAQELDGCRTRFVQNSSSRNGTPVKAIVWHQTVSRDRPGWADQDGLTAMANRRSSGVSWHALIGGIDGNCTFTVPLNLKAWTQGNANPFSVGIEVQAYGDEPAYVSGPGKKRLLAVTRQVARRYDIPLRRGRVENCRPVRSGIVEHSELGACGGGHADVTPWPTDALIAELANGGVTAANRVTCRKINAWRNAGRRHGQWERNTVIRRENLRKRGVTCTARGPART